MYKIVLLSTLVFAWMIDSALSLSSPWTCIQPHASAVVFSWAGMEVEEH